MDRQGLQYASWTFDSKWTSNYCRKVFNCHNYKVLYFCCVQCGCECRRTVFAAIWNCILSTKLVVALYQQVQR